MYPYQP